MESLVCEDSITSSQGLTVTPDPERVTCYNMILEIVLYSPGYQSQMALAILVIG